MEYLSYDRTVHVSKSLVPKVPRLVQYSNIETSLNLLYLLGLDQLVILKRISLLARDAAERRGTIFANRMQTVTLKVVNVPARDESGNCFTHSHAIFYVKSDQRNWKTGVNNTAQILVVTF